MFVCDVRVYRAWFSLTSSGARWCWYSRQRGSPSRPCFGTHSFLCAWCVKGELTACAVRIIPSRFSSIYVLFYLFMDVIRFFVPRSWRSTLSTSLSASAACRSLHCLPLSLPGSLTSCSQIAYGFVSAWAGSSLFNSLCITSYNAILFIPIVSFIINKDVGFDTAMRNPGLYALSVCSLYLSCRFPC